MQHQSYTLKWSRGFTLVELLVVIAIIAALSGLVFALVVKSSDMQERTETEALLHTVASALDLFINETGSVPLPTGSASDPLSGTWYPDELDGSWERQQLWWRLNYQMTGEDREAMRNAADAADVAADPYQSKSHMYSVFPSNRRANFQATLNTVPDDLAESYKGPYTSSSWISTDAAYPDVKSNNDLTVRGEVKALILGVRGDVARELAQRAFATYPCLTLADLPNKKSVRDQTLMDAWEQPIIYIAHSTKEIPYRFPRWQSESGIKPAWSPAGGRIEMSDRNGDGRINQADWDIEPEAEHLIDHNGDGDVNKKDWANVLYYAAEGNHRGYFIASAGSDMQFNCLLNDPMNEDNITVLQNR